MSTEVGSTLQLVDTECIENKDQQVDGDSDLEKHDRESVKTILNIAFDDTEDQINEASAKDVTAEDTDDELDDSVPPSSTPDSEIITPVHNLDDKKERQDGETSLKVCDESELHSSSSSKSIIIGEKDTVEIYFKSDDIHNDDEESEPIAELNITSAVTVQPVSSLSVKNEGTNGINQAVVPETEPAIKHTTEERNVDHDHGNLLHKDSDLYPLSTSIHRNCCYRCWYSETCNDCIIGLIDRIPDRCLCPCLLTCYRCLQIVLCCDWS